jgi:hypothetical protein
LVFILILFLPRNFVFLSSCHFVNLPFGQLAILSTGHFANKLGNIALNLKFIVRYFMNFILLL